MGKRSNRQMIAELVQNDIKENNGVSTEKIHSFNEYDRRRENYD